MSEGTFLSLGVALLLAAAGVLLWDASVRRQRRLQAQRQLAEKIDPQAIPLPQGTMRFGAPTVQVAPGQAARKDAVRLPGWLLGAVAPGALLGGCVAIGVAVSAAALLSNAVSALGLLAMLLIGGAFMVWLKVQSMRRQIIRQLPGFLDVIVRLIVTGNSTHAAFQTAVAGAKQPLRVHMDNAMGLVSAGLDIDQALLQVARKVRIDELFLLASILGLGVRYGGRSDLLLERVANFMRDHEEAEQELVAMSAETRLSAWILGLLPIVVGGSIITTNGDYFARMWTDPTGQVMVVGALALQAVGGLLLYRLARLS
ncbi:type II secretion system F family protein [Hydrogenophaga sp.]|jgi:tight adherence protein B|uniref:type II secretion system F family protein n=1 Tax=Hydrogenophaga sp. TaxID=1904254 RepID=UPI003F71EE11